MEAAATSKRERDSGAMQGRVTETNAHCLISTDCDLRKIAGLQYMYALDRCISSSPPRAAARSRQATTIVMRRGSGNDKTASSSSGTARHTRRRQFKPLGLSGELTEFQSKFLFLGVPNELSSFFEFF